MKNRIERKIESVNESMNWLRENEPEHYASRFGELIEERRRLRRLSRALAEKPAIAAFGESQKGKSYLIGNLLQKDHKPFMVRSGENGEEVNFVASVNPIGNKKEATGVVTRFTSFTSDDERYDERYPVIVKLLTASELGTILGDGYYNDISDFRSYTIEECNSIAEGLQQRYGNRSALHRSLMNADDVMDMREYFKNFSGAATRNMRHSEYFTTVAEIADRLTGEEIVDVLKYLWHENEEITALFRRLIRLSERLKGAKEVYATLESVRHYGDNRNTCMSVDCLNELDDDTPQRLMDIYLKDGTSGTHEKIENVAKCELSALCAEVIFKVREQYLSGKESYFTEGHTGHGGEIRPQTAGLLSESVSKDLLKEVDLLDFPGARSRLKLRESFLNRKDEEAGASNVVQMLLRGKVAFLFNSYNENRGINILLFCHDGEQPAVTDMYNLIDSWVGKYVGTTPEGRRGTIDSYGGISPLFVVGTKFNVDMIESKESEENNESALQQRWDGRFEKVLHRQVFKGSDVKWFGNWEREGESFKNTYLLRDYKFSDCSSSGNNLYEGYDLNDEHPQEERMKLTEEFYERLRRTFEENEWVRKFFRNPALSWDVAATRNNDGSLFIIENLRNASQSAVPARARIMEREMDAAVRRVKGIMETYHVDENLDRILENNIRKGMAVMRELDFSCNTDNYFFGHLLQAMMMTETETLEFVHKKIQSPELIGETNDWKEYELIKERCDEFRGCPDEDSKWDRLQKVYYFRDREDARSYLQRRGVDEKVLFSGETRRKSNSAVISADVLDHWTGRLVSRRFRGTVIGESGFDESVLSDLIENLRNVAEKSGLIRKMEKLISPYVDVVNVANVNEGLVADILADAINDFVTDFGFEMLDDDKRRKALSVVAQTPFGDFLNREEPRHGDFTEEELTELFTRMSDPESGAMTPSFSNRYYDWLEKMFISFVAHSEIPEYDRIANERLGKVIENLEAN
ncbi:MAG: putative virulence factor [Muribaculaceae bacterium]|nr:putative virulence factor [Muribaculaceae bacterium]